MIKKKNSEFLIILIFALLLFLNFLSSTKKLSNTKIWIETQLIKKLIHIYLRNKFLQVLAMHYLNLKILLSSQAYL